MIKSINFKNALLLTTKLTNNLKIIEFVKFNYSKDKRMMFCFSDDIIKIYFESKFINSIEWNISGVTE